MMQRVARRLDDALSLTRYRVRQLTYLPKKPPSTELGRRINRDIKREGVSITSLDELQLPSNPAMLEAMAKACRDLDGYTEAQCQNIEYASGFDHCTPINPSKIAADYPELYLWGLDERLLDLIENLIGLPVAYHGVCARKELVDGQHAGTRVWHTDSEDYNIIRIIIYMSDVLNDEDGPFEYIPRRVSPSIRAFKGIEHRIADEHMERVVPRSRWRRAYGPAGTVLIGAVAKVFHHGKVPKTPRKVAAYYYTSREPRNEELSLEFSFRSGMSLIKAPLTQRQRDCLWKYQPLLPRQ